MRCEDIMFCEEKEGSLIQINNSPHPQLLQLIYQPPVIYIEMVMRRDRCIVRNGISYHVDPLKNIAVGK